jgi:hypothetical protein
MHRSGQRKDLIRQQRRDKQLSCQAYGLLLIAIGDI